MLVILLLSVICPHSFGQTDQTIEQNATGRDVVWVVVKLIAQSQIFKPDNDFLERIAWVETRFGKNQSKTNQGGIWNVDATKLKQTQLSSTSEVLSSIKQKFNITWSLVTVIDLGKPLYSGLCARLWIKSKNDTIPDTIEGQAEYWRKFYLTPIGTTADMSRFITNTKTLENFSICEGKFDMVIVLDGSGSIDGPSFRQIISFLSTQLIDAFTFGSQNVNLGMIEFSDSVNQIIDLSQNIFIPSTLKSRIAGTIQSNGGTATNFALDAAINMLSKKKRIGVPQIIALFTDGGSSNDISTQVSKLRSSNYTTFTVGIGSSINYNELIDIAGNPNQVFNVSSSSILQDFISTLEQISCETPQILNLGQMVNDTLVSEEFRYYYFSIPSTRGLNVIEKDLNGSTRVFYSFSYPTPSVAYNDGEFDTNSQIFTRETSRGSTFIYIGVQGNTTIKTNTYTIQALLAPITPSPTPSPTPKPTPSPTPKPTPSPTPKPTPSPTPKPTPSPTPKPTLLPTPSPTPSSTAQPPSSSTSQPTSQPPSSSTSQPPSSSTSQPPSSSTSQPTSQPPSSQAPVPTSKSSANNLYLFVINLLLCIILVVL